MLYTCEAKRKQPNRTTIWKCKEKWQKADCCFGVFSSFSLLCFVCIIFVFRLMYLMKAIYRHRNTEMAKKQTEKGVYSLAMWKKNLKAECTTFTWMLTSTFMTPVCGVCVVSDSKHIRPVLQWDLIFLDYTIFTIVQKEFCLFCSCTT